MATHQGEPASRTTSSINGSHSNVAHTNGDHHQSKRVDSILKVKDTRIVDGHGDAVVLKGVSARSS